MDGLGDTVKSSTAIPSVEANPGIMVGPQAHKPRDYQLEMLEESLRRNIIVAMDTGSGKTLIATMRIQAELERCPADKLIWFCVPSVALAYQQHSNISVAIPAFESKVLTGADNCEFWSGNIWAEVLRTTRILVSTHAILFDALEHAYVNMSAIALVVFDEAHHALKAHLACRIMSDFYHPLTHTKRPFILGLTASPLVNKELNNLGQLESNLDAICRTPKIHREDLERHVHRPELLPVMYRREESDVLPPSHTMVTLCQMYETLSIEDDPWIQRMRSDPEKQGSKELAKALMKNTTHSHEQLKGLYNRAHYIADELGTSAIDIYTSKCIRKFLTGKDDVTALFESLDDGELLYLKSKLEKVSILPPEQLPKDKFTLSPKLGSLIDFLASEATDSFTGLIFVKQRAEVAMLADIISSHPATRSIFRVGTFVGTSTFTGRKGKLCELATAQGQKTTLEDFRQGRFNLIIATNVLEEGIDVVSCNIVICFEKPPTLKSFIQRRGRARSSISRYVLIFEESADLISSSGWKELENVMKRMYEDETREIRERGEEEEESDDGRMLRVQSTGAQLRLADAVSHLYHFCSTLSNDFFVDPSPTFTFTNHSQSENMKAMSAEVLLPSSVDVSVRKAQSISIWRTEKNARRDAAFQAYKALYHAGLVNDNLVPVRAVDPQVEEALRKIEIRPNIVEVAEQHNLWPEIALAWRDCGALHAARVTVHHPNEDTLALWMLLPLTLLRKVAFDVYWNLQTTFRITIEASEITAPRLTERAAATITGLLLRSAFGGRVSEQTQDYISFFTPSLNISDMQYWENEYSGSLRANDVCYDVTQKSYGIVRDLIRNGTPHILNDVRFVASEDFLGNDVMGVDGSGLPETKDENDTLTIIEATKLSRRGDFLHKYVSASQGTGLRWLLADHCQMDKLPFRYARFALFVPCILHKVHVAKLVEHLCTTLLLPLGDLDRGLITTAICASSAREETNYQRLEFLGDSILKLSTSLALMASHRKYHEDILSKMKDHIVSNGSLARAAIRTGLDAFIITKAFTGAKWRPLYKSELLDTFRQPPKRREMSTKVLADVVESIIGASYVEGGYAKALSCMRIFLPDVPWDSASSAGNIFQEIYGNHEIANPYIDRAEQLTDYRFKHGVLALEAITHASYQSPGVTAPYERLEFLGDSVLDNIVTIAAYNHEPPITVHRLHLIRTALVNADYLGYLCFRHQIAVSRSNVKSEDPQNITVEGIAESFHLWQVLRHSSPTIGHARRACLDRLRNLEDAIQDALETGQSHPWTVLACLDSPKPFSDIIESLLGAIYIDSQGSMEECTKFLEHIGLMKQLRRVIESDVHLLHPKEELGQLADQENVHYVMGKEGEDGKLRLTCTVLVGERELSKVNNGLKPLEVQTRAAEIACVLMRKERIERGRKMPQDEEMLKTADVNRNGSEDDDQSDGGVILEGGDNCATDDMDEDEYFTADEL